MEFVSPTYVPTGSPSNSPTFPLWEKEGCPEKFDASLQTPYEKGTVVEVEGVVYECKTSNGRCHQAGYEPGETYGSEAWTLLGSCTGTSEYYSILRRVSLSSL